MSESTSTAVAEAPEVVTPTQETPTTAVPETPSISTPEAEAAAPAEVEITEDNLDDLPEWKALAQPPEQKSDAAAKDDLPGVANEAVEARVEQVRAQRQNARLQATDANWRDLLVKELGLAPEDATLAWQKVIGPTLREMHADHDAYYQALWKRAVAQALPEDAAKTYMSRQYNGPAEVAKTMYELGKKAAQAEWEGKTAKGELVPYEQAKTLRNAAYDAGFNKGRGLKEAAGEADGASSGANHRGGASDNRSDDAKLLDPNTPVSEIQNILARRGM